MKTRSRELFTTVRTEGGLLPGDLLQRITHQDPDIDGLQPHQYHLAKGETLKEAISRSWNRLLVAWKGFQSALAELPEGDRATSATRDRWLLILFQELGYGHLVTAHAREIDGKSYPISHQWQHCPIHLVGSRIQLDTRTPGVAGAAQASPHSLVQEFLNRSEDHRWGIVSNGLRLRLLRDNLSLTRQAFVEFDLEAMMEGEVYSDFALLWLLAHQSRVEGEAPDDCWLEHWSHLAQEQGTRALDDLRDGVEAAIGHLGAGFLAHPANGELLRKLRSGELATQDYYRQVLRLVYRLLFLFVAEDRDLLLDPDGPESVKETYRQYYSTARIRRLAGAKYGTQHPDLYRALKIVMAKLGHAEGCPELGLPPLGSYLWSTSATADLNDCELANRDLLQAFRDLAYIEAERQLLPVDYKNLGSEELGSVYESLLELHPELNTQAATFELKVASGNERKTTGSYYTHPSLVNCLLDTALDPVLDDATKRDDPEHAILDLKICDPACGSGNFLIHAAHRVAKRLATVRTGDDEPSPDETRTALRDVIGHCVYGVDMNPMAVELCKVSLWMEALEPGKPLSFLDHRIKVGNSLLGTTPRLIQEGIPNDAFKAIEGDDNEFCKEYKKKNRKERAGYQALEFDAREPWDQLGNLAAGMMKLDDIDDETLDGIQRKQERYRELVRSSGYRFGQLLADAWCAAFVWPKRYDDELPYPITESVLRDRIERNPNAIPKWLSDEIQRLATQYQFFHWHLEFPDVFRVSAEQETPENEETGWNGGFDVVLGNPPWEQLEQQDSVILDKVIEGVKHFIERSGKFLFTGKGRKNLYGLFAELASQELSRTGNIGLVLPTGILQDKPAASLTEALAQTARISSVYDFQNRRETKDGEKWFPDAHPQQRFSLVTISNNSPSTQFVFDVEDFSDLRSSNRAYYQTYDDIKKLCDHSFRIPMFRNSIDARIAEISHDNGTLIGYLLRDSSSLLKSGLLFNAEPETNAAKQKSRDNDEDDLLKVYEGSYIHQYDHRFATYRAQSIQYSSRSEKARPDYMIHTEYMLPKNMVSSRLAKIFNTRPKWLLVLRRQARAADSLVSISAVIPCTATEGSLTAFHFEKNRAEDTALLCANLNSFMFNFLTSMRQSGANLNKNVYSHLPIIPEPSSKKIPNAVTFVSTRTLELVYTAWDLEHFAKDCGYDGPPFCWDEERRFWLRCELDAAFFHLYLGTPAEWAEQNTGELLESYPTPRDAVDYIMETFPIVRRNDEEAHGEYRTKQAILDIYDEMQRAIDTGEPYETHLDPPPADPRVAHPPRES